MPAPRRLYSPGFTIRSSILTGHPPTSGCRTGSPATAIPPTLGRSGKGAQIALERALEEVGSRRHGTRGRACGSGGFGRPAHPRGSRYRRRCHRGVHGGAAGAEEGRRGCCQGESRGRRRRGGSHQGSRWRPADRRPRSHVPERGRAREAAHGGRRAPLGAGLRVQQARREARGGHRRGDGAAGTGVRPRPHVPDTYLRVDRACRRPRRLPGDRRRDDAEGAAHQREAPCQHRWGARRGDVGNVRSALEQRPVGGRAGHRPVVTEQPRPPRRSGGCDG